MQYQTIQFVDPKSVYFWLKISCRWSPSLSDYRFLKKHRNSVPRKWLLLPVVTDTLWDLFGPRRWITDRCVLTSVHHWGCSSTQRNTSLSGEEREGEGAALYQLEDGRMENEMGGRLKWEHGSLNTTQSGAAACTKHEEHRTKFWIYYLSDVAEKRTQSWRSTLDD